MKQGFYNVKTANYVFLMEVIEYSRYITINYGDPLNKEGPCCILTYDLEIPERIKLDGISYYARCSNGKDLEKSIGTVEMLQSILKICVDSYPEIKRICFNDVSGFECNGKHLYLSYLGLLTHGQTWYERHFSAKSVSTALRDNIQTFKSFLSQKPSRGVFSFYDHTIKAYTWYDYFNTIKKEQGCLFFIENKTEIKAKARLDLLYSEWYISSRKAKSYDIIYEIKRRRRPKQGGGHTPWQPIHCLSYEDLL